MPKCDPDKPLAQPGECLLLVIDVQERLIGSISNAQAVVANIAALIKTAQIFHIPVLTTEQEKLGPTVPQLKDLLDLSDAPSPVTKSSFSSWPSPAFRQALGKMNRKRLLITGLESHICISQTSLDLLANNYQLYVVADATSSYSVQDRQVALDRLSSQGAILTTTEALIYELTATAQAPEFKKILQVVKDRRNTFSKLPPAPGTA